MSIFLRPPSFTQSETRELSWPNLPHLHDRPCELWSIVQAPPPDVLRPFFVRMSPSTPAQPHTSQPQPRPNTSRFSRTLTASHSQLPTTNEPTNEPTNKRQNSEVRVPQSVSQSSFGPPFSHGVKILGPSVVGTTSQPLVALCAPGWAGDRNTNRSATTAHTHTHTHSHTAN